MNHLLWIATIFVTLVVDKNKAVVGEGTGEVNKSLAQVSVVDKQGFVGVISSNTGDKPASVVSPSFAAPTYLEPPFPNPQPPLSSPAGKLSVESSSPPPIEIIVPDNFAKQELVDRDIRQNKAKEKPNQTKPKEVDATKSGLKSSNGISGKDYNSGQKHKLFVDTRLSMQDGASGDLDCDDARGPLRQIFKKSRYFADVTHKYNYNEARQVCDDHQLVLADLDSWEDHRSLQLFFNYQITTHTFSATDDKYFIGLNDIKVEGSYVKGDGKNITFQTYHSSQPDDRDMDEDCTTIGKEFIDGPIGMSDENCMKKFHVFCMFPHDSSCVNETKEAKAHYKMLNESELPLLINLTKRSYHVSNFQTPWENALEYCNKRSMRIFDMDHIVTMQFFRELLNWETKFANDSVPTVQYWTGGRFKGSHMKAEVFWHNDESIHSGHEDQKPPHNYTYSGIFKWNTYKKGDPGAAHFNRKDLCLSFGFENKPDSTPFVRNTNCDIPCYFLCSKDIPEEKHVATDDE